MNSRLHRRSSRTSSPTRKQHVCWWDRTGRKNKEPRLRQVLRRQSLPPVVAPLMADQVAISTNPGWSSSHSAKLRIGSETSAMTRLRLPSLPAQLRPVTDTTRIPAGTPVARIPRGGTDYPARALLLSQRGTLTPNSTVSMLDPTVRRSVPSAHAAAGPQLRASQGEVQ
jgi:hypothetical protein